jgi:hypothetical protein
MARLTSSLYKAARLTNTIGALTSGDSRRAGRRVKNVVVGRVLARGGFWRKLWGGGK